MGNALKPARSVQRFFRNWNAEERAHKAIQKERIPKTAPRHPSTVQKLEEFAKEHPELLDEQRKKDDDLLERLKYVRVDSHGDNPEIVSTRALPERRTKAPIGDYGYIESTEVQLKEGRFSLKTGIDILNKHYMDPDYNAEKIAKDHHLDVDKVHDILSYFKSCQLHFPKRILDKNPALKDQLKELSDKNTVSTYDHMKGFFQVIGSASETETEKWSLRRESVEDQYKEEEDHDEKSDLKRVPSKNDPTENVENNQNKEISDNEPTAGSEASVKERTKDS